MSVSRTLSQSSFDQTDTIWSQYESESHNEIMISYREQRFNNTILFGFSQGSLKVMDKCSSN